METRIFIVNLRVLFLAFCFDDAQLFHFDVHEDVRTIADATIEKDEVYFQIYFMQAWLLWLLDNVSLVKSVEAVSIFIFFSYSYVQIICIFMFKCYSPQFLLYNDAKSSKLITVWFTGLIHTLPASPSGTSPRLIRMGCWLMYQNISLMWWNILEKDKN